MDYINYNNILNIINISLPRASSALSRGCVRFTGLLTWPRGMVGHVTYEPGRSILEEPPLR